MPELDSQSWAHTEAAIKEFCPEPFFIPKHITSAPILFSSSFPIPNVPAAAAWLLSLGSGKAEPMPQAEAAFLVCFTQIQHPLAQMIVCAQTLYPHFFC